MIWVCPLLSISTTATQSTIPLSLECKLIQKFPSQSPCLLFSFLILFNVFSTQQPEWLSNMRQSSPIRLTSELARRLGGVSKAKLSNWPVIFLPSLITSLLLHPHHHGSLQLLFLRPSFPEGCEQHVRDQVWGCHGHKFGYTEEELSN